MSLNTTATKWHGVWNKHYYHGDSYLLIEIDSMVEINFSPTGKYSS